MHDFTRVHSTHTAPHINTKTYHTRLAGSVRVREQQHCHHLWPSVLRYCMMQRQLARLHKSRPRASSAPLTAGRQALYCSQLCRWCCACVLFDNLFDVNACIHTHTCICTQSHAHIHTYICKFMHAHTHIHMHKYTRTQANTY